MGSKNGISVDTNPKHTDFETPKQKSVLNTSKAKGGKSNYNNYKMAKPGAIRDIKTGSNTHTSSKSGLHSTKRSMKGTNSLSHSIAYASNYR
jgi:hypothetical protein